jgi:phage terminase large subunit
VDELERFLAAARGAGCPQDQVRGFIRAGYVPQPKQLRFHAMGRACDAQNGPVEVGFGGARGGGKSHCMLGQVGVDDCQRYPGLKVLLLRKIAKAAKESFLDLRGRVLSGLTNEYKSHEGLLIFPNGSRIFLGHFHNEGDVDAYLGLEYDVIAVEEATTLSSAKYKMIRTCLRTSKPDWRPRMYSSTNPGGVGHAWYRGLFIEPYRRHQEIDTRFVPSTVDDNRFVNAEYRATLDKLTGWQKRAWRYGDWDIAAGQFFTTWREDVHVAGQMPAARDLRRVWCALDYGFTHFTVCYLLGEDSDGSVLVLDEHAERRWVVARHAEAIHAMLERHGLAVGQLDDFVAGRDVFSKERDGKTVAAEYAQHAILLSAANDDRIQGAAELLSRLGDPDVGVPATLTVAQRCRRLIECLPALEHDPHRAEDVLKVDCDDDGVGGDDPYDALRYGVMMASSLRTGYGASPTAGWRG